MVARDGLMTKQVRVGFNSQNLPGGSQFQSQRTERLLLDSLDTACIRCIDRNVGKIPIHVFSFLKKERGIKVSSGYDKGMMIFSGCGSVPVCL